LNRTTDPFGTTGGPAVIYFPTGNYLLAQSIQLYVNTFLIGNPNDRPQLQASSSFDGTTMVFGKDWNQPSTNNFYIGMKNIILVSTAVSADTSFTLLDWSVSQATQLTNVEFDMPDSSEHTGLAMPESPSGTIIGNLLFQGGLYGINMNSEQYLIKDTTFERCNTAIYISHGFDIVVQNATFENCTTGIDGTFHSFDGYI
jgi:glucan 1,3-beta-glucosidase